MSTKRAPVDDIEALRDVLKNADVLLLDFDGPVCSVFAGFPAPVVADQLRDVLRQDSGAQLPTEILKTEDPFDVLKFASTLSRSDAEYVEAALRAHEVEAVRSAEVTPSAHDLIKSWHTAGRKQVIVSNNAALAVQGYLNLHSLTGYIDFNFGRNSSDPTLLKPSPFLLTQAITALGVAPSQCVMLGDSTSDMIAAKRAGTTSIGFANKPTKVDQLANESHAVTQSITLLLEAFKGLEFQSGRQ